MNTQTKTFDSVHKYMRDISMLVPGYEVLHDMIPCLVQELSQSTSTRVLVVGSGPGHEAINLAHKLSEATIDCLDPSEPMVSAARSAIAHAQLGARMSVHHGTLNSFNVTQPYDVVLATLVGHFVPDDGSRANFFARIRQALCPGGTALLTEFMHLGAQHDLMLTAHVQHAHKLGLPEARQSVLHERMQSSFHSLTFDRFLELAAGASLNCDLEFFRMYTVTGHALSSR